jgi:hypothetical protein
MGGKNHQPCRKYIPESTMLSKVTSDILREFETANSLLEDALLTEINGGESEQEKYYMEQATEHLITTKNRLVRAIGCIDHLLLKMEKLDFQDSEELDIIAELESNLLLQQIIPERCSAWKEAVATIEQEGFRGIFYRFRISLEKITEDLKTLIEIFGKCQNYAKEGNLLMAIESNELPVRQNFVKVYLAYMDFSAMFACSSLVSTELHLKTSGYPSLAITAVSPEKEAVKVLSEIP